MPGLVYLLFILLLALGKPQFLSSIVSQKKKKMLWLFLTSKHFDYSNRSLHQTQKDIVFLLQLRLILSKSLKFVSKSGSINSIQNQLYA